MPTDMERKEPFFESEKIVTPSHPWMVGLFDVLGFSNLVTDGDGGVEKVYEIYQELIQRVIQKEGTRCIGLVKVFPNESARYAFDFVQLDNNRVSSHSEATLRFFVKKISSDKFYCWSKPVYAPIDGTVIRVGNGWRDHEYTNIWKTIQIWYNATYRFRPKEENGRVDIRPNAGNHVMIKAKEGHIVFLAHLKNQSILVKEGQRVRQGEEIGMVGNSGNSTAPHLHINLFDQVENPFKSNVLPFVFNDYDSLSSEGQWITYTSSVPKVGAFVRFHA